MASVGAAIFFCALFLMTAVILIRKRLKRRRDKSLKLQRLTTTEIMSDMVPVTTSHYVNVMKNAGLEPKTLLQSSVTDLRTSKKNLLGSNTEIGRTEKSVDSLNGIASPSSISIRTGYSAAASSIDPNFFSKISFSTKYSGPVSPRSSTSRQTQGIDHKGTPTLPPTRDRNDLASNLTFTMNSAIKSFTLMTRQKGMYKTILYAGAYLETHRVVNPGLSAADSRKRFCHSREDWGRRQWKYSYSSC